MLIKKIKNKEKDRSLDCQIRRLHANLGLVASHNFAHPINFKFRILSLSNMARLHV
jgi:hypothetical protein